MNMPPRRKSRRTAGPADDTVDVQFVPDPVEISPQAAVEASTSGAGSESLSDAMVSSIVAAVKTALQSRLLQVPSIWSPTQCNTTCHQSPILQWRSLSRQVVRYYPLRLYFLV